MRHNHKVLAKRSRPCWQVESDRLAGVADLPLNFTKGNFKPGPQRPLCKICGSAIQSMVACRTLDSLFIGIPLFTADLA